MTSATQPKRCIIVGAGGMAREVLSWALHLTQVEWRVAGFLDSNPRALEGKNLPYEVLGDPAQWQPAPDEVFIAAIGDPKSRLSLCRALKSKGARFVTIVHPTVIFGLNAVLGEGCVIAPYVVVSTAATLGDFVFVNLAATVGHDTTVGEGVTVSSHCDIMADAVLEPECFLGGHACVLPGKRVGRGATVGAGSSVVRSVPPGATVMGVPAQILMMPKP